MIRPRPESIDIEIASSGNNPQWQELRDFAGQWIAFSGDGLRIVAHGKDLAELDRRVVEAGEDPEEVSLLRVSDDTMIFSGSEFQ